MESMKTVKLSPRTSRLLDEVSAKRKKSYRSSRSKQDIIAELVEYIYSKEITGEA